MKNDAKRHDRRVRRRHSVTGDKRYFMSAKQMGASKHDRDVLQSISNRGGFDEDEIGVTEGFQCGCGCGTIAHAIRRRDEDYSISRKTW